MKPKEALNKLYIFRYYTQWYPAHSYTIDEAATLLGIEPETLHSYVAANELPAEPMGSSYRIAVNDIEDFLLAKSKGINLRRERRCVSV